MKKFILIFFFLPFISCSSSDDEVSIENPQETEYTFSIIQSKKEIYEFDNVVFNLLNSGNISIYSIQWYIDDVEIDINEEINKTFMQSGNYKIKARIQHYNRSNTDILTTMVEKEIIVMPRAYYSVKIKKIEILSYSDFDNFAFNHYGVCSLISYFQIIELDEFGNPSIKYISSENNINEGVFVSNFQPMVWNISNVNYTVKVFQTGNYFPNGQSNHTHFKIFGASVAQGTPYSVINNYHVNLNSYRDIKPSTISENVNGMQIRLSLEWN